MFFKNRSFYRVYKGSSNPPLPFRGVLQQILFSESGIHIITIRENVNASFLFVIAKD